ncbi:hypothetical protein [Chitinophaga silvisoli]|uniref:Uncharacterized protein n=1 Tax=Chitinophaga silvisoli TaxID=2291814 RepID=A0A3E1P7U3_9BACT|nr:hypothetical protein [Chitinophaga silvisoli]RFM36231.1 hypothetical protein DXN04_01610 [Chitinophaga silvisoli]
MKLVKITAKEQKEVINLYIMELYTFLMQFRGGTYISQVESKNLSEATTLWVKQLKIEEIKHLGEKGQIEMIKEAENFELFALKSLKNIWFFCFGIKAGFIMVNVVKTDNK